MPTLLTGTPLTDGQRVEHDTHHNRTVWAALGVVTIYIWLFTQAFDYLGIPGPQDLIDRLGVLPQHLVDDDGSLNSDIRITLGSVFDRGDDERLVLYVVAALAFLSAYYLPVRHKRTAIAGWSVLGFMLLFGLKPTLVLLAVHTVVYLTLHPKADRPLAWGSSPGLLLLANGLIGDAGAGEAAAWAAAPFCTAFAYRFMWLPALDSSRIAPVLRTIVVQSAIMTLFAGVLLQGGDDREWVLPAGLVLFFFQWQRLIMYHVDHTDGHVPYDLALRNYLVVFFTPATIPSVNLRPAIGQGYAYLESRFLCADKNRIVASGSRLLLLALVYLVFGDTIRYAADDLISSVGVNTYGSDIEDMVKAFMAGERVTTASVLATTFLELLRWLLFFAGIAHFKVGLWRLCGYAVDPAYDKPWLATNMASLWTRYTFHYREFLVRAFYYPVFFRLARLPALFRIFLATVAATTVGNLIWGHAVYRLNARGISWDNLTHHFERWPYFVLLGGSIAACHVYTRWRKRRRKPWTRDRWLWTDALAVYITLQWFALIHVFTRPVHGATAWDLFRLFAQGLGITID